MSDHNQSEPLLHPGASNTHEEEHSGQTSHRIMQWLRWSRKAGQRLLESRTKHFIIMAIVALDVAALLANVFIQLIACETHQSDRPWVERASEALETLGLIFSTLFLLELIACLLAFGLGFLASWFHLFDATVIIASFIIDITSKGLTESIGSLVVVLRLWRLAKISEEVVLGTAERMEILEMHLEELERENSSLRAQLGHDAMNHSGNEV